MTTDLPALDTYDAEIVDITVSYSIRISQAEATAAEARRTLAEAEATLAELTSERAAAVHQARERLLTATGAEIRDGGIRGKPGRPTRRAEPALVGGAGGTGLSTACANANAGLPGGAAGTLTFLPPNGATDPAIVAGVAEASAILAAPAGEAPTAAETFIDAVSEPERSLYEQGFTAAEVAATPIEEQWRLKRANVSRADVRQTASGTWYEPVTPPPDPIENEEAPF